MYLEATVHVIIVIQLKNLNLDALSTKAKMSKEPSELKAINFSHTLFINTKNKTLFTKSLSLGVSALGFEGCKIGGILQLL